MSSEDTDSAARWLETYLGTGIPADHLGAAVAATRRIATGVGQRADALVMEDEPAGYRLALLRLQDKR